MEKTCKEFENGASLGEPKLAAIETLLSTGHRLLTDLFDLSGESLKGAEASLHRALSSMLGTAPPSCCNAVQKLIRLIFPCCMMRS